MSFALLSFSASCQISLRLHTLTKKVFPDFLKTAIWFLWTIYDRFFYVNIKYFRLPCSNYFNQWQTYVMTLFSAMDNCQISSSQYIFIKRISQIPEDCNLGLSEWPFYFISHAADHLGNNKVSSSAKFMLWYIFLPLMTVTCMPAQTHVNDFRKFWKAVNLSFCMSSWWQFSAWSCNVVFVCIKYPSSLTILLHSKSVLCFFSQFFFFLADKSNKSCAY